MTEIPETIYVVNSIVGWRVLGYRNKNRTAHHLHNPSCITIAQEEMIETLQNINIPVQYNGFLYGTQRTTKIFSELFRTKRGYCYHPVLESRLCKLEGQYIIENDARIKLDKIMIDNGEWESKPSAHPGAWNFMYLDDEYPMILADVSKLHPNVIVNRYDNSLYLSNITTKLYYLDIQ